LSSRTLAWLALLLIVVLALAMVVVPVWLIQPFAPQTEGGLAVSFTLRRWSPILTLVALASALIAIAWLWRGSRWWRKAIMIVMLVPLLSSVWFARQNHFEWMFHPLPGPSYAKISATDFVADTDMVMAVESNGEAVAYPVRLMAYHHIVQDVVGGTPIVATY
jgi:Protein of unknown function (DUF3179)